MWCCVEVCIQCDWVTAFLKQILWLIETDMIEFHHRGPSFAFPGQKWRENSVLSSHCCLFCVFFQALCLWAGVAMDRSELKSNLRCFTVISRLCCCCGDCCTDSEWGRGTARGLGWVYEWVGSRVGVGLFFCRLHFPPSPSREGMVRGSCHLTCECFEGGPGVFRKLFFFLPPTRPIFQAEAAWSLWAAVRPRRSALLAEKGESVRLKAWGR